MMGRIRLRPPGQGIAHLRLRQPLRHPWPLVQQRSGGKERFQRNVDDGGHEARVARERPSGRGASSSSPKNSSFVAERQPTRISEALVALSDVCAYHVLFAVMLAITAKTRSDVVDARRPSR